MIYEIKDIKYVKNNELRCHMTRTEKNLKMRVYRLIYIFRFSVKKNNCDEDSYKNMTI